jgi:hypothetical protein
MAKRKIKADVQDALIVLYALHQHIMEEKPYPDYLLDNGYTAWSKLSDWKSNDPECQKHLEFLKHLLLDQLAWNDVLVLKAEINDYKEKCKEAKEKLDKISHRAIPDHQTTLGHA